MSNIETVRTYFRRIDQGEFAVELFAPDFEFFFPKFGLGRGPAEFQELAIGMAQAGNRAQHHHDRLRFFEAERHVTVEGTTQGSASSGEHWNGGETPGGRFCSTFDFTTDGLIERMYVYLDPDYTSADTPRFHWARSQPRW